MYTYKALENIDIPTVYRTFIDAFSDYQINIKLSIEAFEIMLKRRGFVSAFSIGAFTESGELVGFILNGCRDWHGKLTAYDLGTGVVPSHRKRGLSRNMFQSVLKIMEQNNLEQYLLEVLQENKAAYELYRSQGLTIVRNYSCFRLNKSDHTPHVPLHQVDYLTEINQSEWEQLKQFLDFEPSWQNSIDSILAVHTEFVYPVIRIDNNIVGYGVVDIKTGDVPQFAVHKEHRRKGIATDIFAALLRSTEADVLQIINVDDDCEGTKLFLNKLGCKLTVSQYEMMK